MINMKTIDVYTAATIHSICARVILLGNKLTSKGVKDVAVGFSWSSASNCFDIQLSKWDGDDCISSESQLWYVTEKFKEYSREDIYKALEEWEKTYGLE